MNKTLFASSALIAGALIFTGCSNVNPPEEPPQTTSTSASEDRPPAKKPSPSATTAHATDDQAMAKAKYGAIPQIMEPTLPLNKLDDATHVAVCTLSTNGKLTKLPFEDDRHFFTGSDDMVATVYERSDDPPTDRSFPECNDGEIVGFSTYFLNEGPGGRPGVLQDATK